MKNQKSLKVWGLLLIILSVAFVFSNILWSYAEDAYYLVSMLPLTIGALLLGAGIGYHSSSNIYFLSDILNGKSFLIHNDAWRNQDENSEGKTVLCEFPKKQYFLLFVPKDFYANTEIYGKAFIKHEEKVYRD